MTLPQTLHSTQQLLKQNRYSHTNICFSVADDHLLALQALLTSHVHTFSKSGNPVQHT